MPTADSAEDDPDVLDGRIGEQPFHVGLRRREHDAVDRREQTEGERRQAPPPRRLTQQVECHAQDAVERGLQHHAAHQRRHGRRRGRVCFRQPDVGRHQARLGAETEQGQGEGDR
jgi:hypothetical protein